MLQSTASKRCARASEWRNMHGVGFYGAFETLEGFKGNHTHFAHIVSWTDVGIDYKKLCSDREWNHRSLFSKTQEEKKKMEELEQTENKSEVDEELLADQKSEHLKKLKRDIKAIQGDWEITQRSYQDKSYYSTYLWICEEKTNKKDIQIDWRSSKFDRKLSSKHCFRF